MKINSNFNTYKLQKYSIKPQFNNAVKSQNMPDLTNLNLQATNYPIFTGGYSIDLKETYKHLQENDYPVGIKAKVEKNLKNSTDNKTLYDIHFEKYRGVNDCYTLEELKEKYPEFNNVISAYSVEAQDRSIIGKWQNGNSTLFSSDEDLTLQLIKLYWGQGFSLKDLSSYAKNLSEDEKGINFYHTLTKLNIPTMSVRYAKVLKLSNKEYNEKFTQTLSQKIKEAKEEKQQELEGEPIFIPSKPHSDSHRQHISEGLLKYYSENPDAIYKMSIRQKEFYQKNPDKKEEFSMILDYAWNNTQDGKTIKKQLSRFFKKHNRELSDNELNSPSTISSKNIDLMQKFWQINTWAKEKLSIAMKKGWQYIKTPAVASDNKKIDGINVTTARCLPDKVINEVRKIAKASGSKLPDSTPGTIYIFSSEEYMQKFEKEKNDKDVWQDYINIYLKQNPKEVDKIATVLHYSTYSLFKNLRENSKDLPSELKNDERKRLRLITEMVQLNKIIPIFTDAGFGFLPVSNTPEAEVDKYFCTLLTICMNDKIINANIIGDYYNKLLDKNYRELNKLMAN